MRHHIRLILAAAARLCLPAGLGRVAWQFPEQSSTILVLNKAGQIQWAKDGSLTPEEVDHVIALAQKLINE